MSSIFLKACPMPMATKNPLYDDEAIYKRWSLLLTTFYKFREAYRRDPDVRFEIDIDALALFQAVKSYFHDVARFKLWHFSDPQKDLIDGRKMFAFTIHWLMRTRPVYVVANPKKVEATPSEFLGDPALTANAHFAVVVGFTFLGFSVHGASLQELLYHVTYRCNGPSELMLFADALKSIVVGGVAGVLRTPNGTSATLLSAEAD